MEVKILHVDDHVLFSEGLSALFLDSNRFKLIKHIPDTESAITFCKKQPPDLIIMDYYFPRGNGIDAAKSILSFLPFAKIIMLTMATDFSIVHIAKQIGIVGYLSKNTSHSELFEAISAVRNNETWFPNNIIESHPDNKKKYALSNREKQIAKLVAQGYSTAKIANTLFISELTVSTHRKNILRKLKLENSVQLGNYIHLFH
jgi:DNA-binding NarL/FixJ family response regulator